MTDYPRTVQRFIPWTKAMVAGATLGKPDYGKSLKTRKTKRRKRRKRKKKNGSKD